MDPTCFNQQKKGPKPESEKIDFCIENYKHFDAPFWRLVSVMTVNNVKEHRNAGDFAPKHFAL